MSWARASDWSKAPTRNRRRSRISEKTDVDAAFLRLMQLLLDVGNVPGHRHARPGDDRRHPVHTRSSAASRRTASSSRCCMESDATCRPHSRPTATACALYVPFGREWFPYFMRRLGERPANLGFVVRGILQEQ